MPQEPNLNIASDKDPGRHWSVKYKPEFCEWLIEHMREGKSFLSFGACIFEKTDGKTRVGKSTLEQWVQDYKAFREAKDIGRLLSLEWWETKGQTNLLMDKDTRFNGTVYNLAMINRHGYKSGKSDIGSDPERPIRVKQEVIQWDKVTDSQLNDMFEQLIDDDGTTRPTETDPESE